MAVISVPRARYLGRMIAFGLYDVGGRRSGRSPAGGGRVARETTAPRGAIVREAMTFEDIVRDNQEAVYGAALRILGDRDAALETANTAFIKAYRAIASYDPSRPIRPWLLRIATNEALTVGRRRTRERARSAPVEAAADVAEPAPTPEGEALHTEERGRIHAAVAKLPELYRVVVVLRYFNELSVDEIARITGRSSSAVGVQLLRARRRLSKTLADGSV